jgi:hypothetical protein
MKIKKVGNVIQITLNTHEKYNVSIYEQLEIITKKYPDYDTKHAHRTEYGWEIKSLKLGV